MRRSAAARRSDSAAPVGFWPRGVTITARAPAASAERETVDRGTLGVDSHGHRLEPQGPQARNAGG